MQTFTLHVSSIYIALLGLLLLSLALRVVIMRFRYKVGIGDGKHPPLQLAVRTHANATEYIPTALLLLIAVENTWHNQGLTHAMGSVLFIARALHAIGLSQSSGTSKPRVLGTLLTWGMMATSAIAILVFSLS